MPEDILEQKFSFEDISQNPSREKNVDENDSPRSTRTVLCFKILCTTGVNISMTICERGLSRQC